MAKIHSAASAITDDYEDYGEDDVLHQPTMTKAIPPLSSSAALLHDANPSLNDGDDDVVPDSCPFAEEDACEVRTLVAFCA